MSLKRNLVLQVVYRIVVTLTPLITTPYVARVLGADGVGTFSYTQSIISIFTSIAMLGFTDYGARTIAMTNKKSRIGRFWEVYSAQFIFSTAVFVLFCILTALFFDEKYYLFLQSFWIVAYILDISWYYFGIEDVKSTVIKNMVTKVLTIACIFIFVRNQNDLSKYMLIMSIGNLFGSILLWPRILRNHKIERIRLSKVLRHIKPALVLYIPLFAMGIYSLMDRTMLGVFSSEEQGGYYYNSWKIVNIPTSVITGVGTIMLARISQVKQNKGSNNATELFRRALSALFCISVPMSFGILSVSNDFIPLFLGDQYLPCILLTQLLSITVITKSISSSLQTQYLIPFNMERIYIISVITGALLNLLLNYIFIFILNYSAIGATVATIVSELVVMTIELVVVGKALKMRTEIFKHIPLLMIGFVMSMVVIVISRFVRLALIFKILIEILVGIIVYSVLAYFYLKKYNKETLRLLLGFISKRRMNEKN